MKYPVVIHKDEKTVYGVTVPDLSGCYSSGDSIEEALKYTLEAIELHLESIIEDREDIPSASPIEKLINDESFCGGIWAIVDVDLTPYLGKSEKINITLPRLLIHKIDEHVAKHKEHKNRSNYLANLARQDLKLD